jgi:integrase
MAHIEDRWFNTVEGPDGKPVRVKTKLHGIGLRYRVRYIDPMTGRERKKSFPDRARRAAENFMNSVEADKLRGTYIDPDAGLMLFRDYAETWLRTRRMDESSREGVEIRVRNHLYPHFGAKALSAIKPGDVREWEHSVEDAIGPGTRAVVFTHLRTILGAAVDDGKIGKNPCTAKSVDPPRPPERTVKPWTTGQVDKIRDCLPARYKAMVDMGRGAGMRQGEIFGFSPEDVDFDQGWINIRRQVKRVRSRLVFGLPKNDKERRVPLSTALAEILALHADLFPPATVTLPWEDPVKGPAVTVVLYFTTTHGNAISRAHFNERVWHPALDGAGIERSRATGMHALRHLFASTLLNAGETIKALAEYLGHADPGFTLRVYTHIMPTSQERTRRAVDAMLGGIRKTATPWRRPGRYRARRFHRSKLR